MTTIAAMNVVLTATSTVGTTLRKDEQSIDRMRANAARPLPPLQMRRGPLSPAEIAAREPIPVRANTSQAEQAIRRIGQQVRQTRGEAERPFRLSARGGLGGMGANLLAGAGAGMAVAAAVGAAHALGELGKEVSDLSQKYQAGEITQRAYYDGLVRSIPVIGQVSGGLYDFGAGMSDLAAHIAEVNGAGDEWVAWLESAASKRAAMERIAETGKAGKDIVARLENERSLTAAVTDAERERIQVEQQHQKNLAEIAEWEKKRQLALDQKSFKADGERAAAESLKGAAIAAIERREAEREVLQLQRQQAETLAKSRQADLQARQQQLKSVREQLAAAEGRERSIEQSQGGVGAAVKGSREAFSAIRASERRNDPQLQEAKQQTRLLRDMLRKLENLDGETTQLPP